MAAKCCAAKKLGFLKLCWIDFEEACNATRSRTANGKSKRMAGLSSAKPNKEIHPTGCWFQTPHSAAVMHCLRVYLLCNVLRCTNEIGQKTGWFAYLKHTIKHVITPWHLSANQVDEESHWTTMSFENRRKHRPFWRWVSSTLVGVYGICTMYLVTIPQFL